MGVQLLDKTRKINKLLHNNNSHKFVFNDICKVLSEILLSNILVISKKGKVLGIKDRPDIETINELINNEVGEYIDPLLNERLLGVLSTKENVNLETLGFEFSDISEYQAIITPIDIAGERLGTVFMYRKEKHYEIDDIIGKTGIQYTLEEYNVAIQSKVPNICVLFQKVDYDTSVREFKKELTKDVTVGEFENVMQLKFLIAEIMKQGHE